MQSTLKPKPTDDPHDVLVVAPDVAVIAPTDEELFRLARTLRDASNSPTHTPSAPSEGPTMPPVDTTFRPAAVGDVKIAGRRPTIGGRAARSFTMALLLAACTGAAAIAWQSYGDAAEQMIARWAPQRILAALLPLEKPALAAPPAAVEATTAADAASAQPAPSQPASTAQAAPEGVAPAPAAPSAGPAPSIGSVANDLASARQEIEQLKASIEELKASQQQMSGEIAKVAEAKVSQIKPSERNLRPKPAAHPLRAAEVRARKPMPPPPLPQAASYPASPPATAPYVPRQVEPLPQTTAGPPADPELASVPRPPMPVR